MRYVDSYNKIRELKIELGTLRRVFYNYDVKLPSKTFNKLKKQIKEVENKIEFLENMRKANGKVRKSK